MIKLHDASNEADDTAFDTKISVKDEEMMVGLYRFSPVSSRMAIDFLFSPLARFH